MIYIFFAIVCQCRLLFISMRIRFPLTNDIYLAFNSLNDIIKSHDCYKYIRQYQIYLSLLWRK